MWMPNRWPSSRISRAWFNAPSDLEPPERSTGNTPTEVNHHFLNLPLMPLPSKYSALPMKWIMRGQVIGSSASSMTARWFAAMMAPPCLGMFCRPLTVGPRRRRAIQPNPLTKNQYSIVDFLLVNSVGAAWRHTWLEWCL